MKRSAGLAAVTSRGRFTILDGASPEIFMFGG